MNAGSPTRGETACWWRYVTINTVSSLRRDSCSNCGVCERVIRKQHDSDRMNKDDGEGLCCMIWSGLVRSTYAADLFFISAQIPWNCDAATTVFKTLLLRSDQNKTGETYIFSCHPLANKVQQESEICCLCTVAEQGYVLIAGCVQAKRNSRWKQGHSEC